MVLEEVGSGSGLSAEVIEKINRVFAGYPEINEVVLYGSRAKGNPRTGSDIDLTLKGADLALGTLNQVSLDLDDLLLPYSFDLSIFHRIREPNLLEHIERVGKLFYRKANHDSVERSEWESAGFGRY